MSSTSTEYFTECFGSIKLRSTTKLEDDKITWHSHRYFKVYIPDYNVNYDCGMTNVLVEQNRLVQLKCNYIFKKYANFNLKNCLYGYSGKE